MKKLNRKGFTLIELLAVIVILAIIIVVTVPTILNSIDEARLSSLHSLSKEFANWYDTSYANDMIAIGDDKILYGIEITDKWQCLRNLKVPSNNASIPDAKKGKTLAELYNLSRLDVMLSGNAPSNDDVHSSTISNCSAIRRNSISGSAEVFLVANPGGRFYVSNVTFALSSDSNGMTNP